MTVWREVPGWSGWYSISDEGQVRAEVRTIQRSTGHPYTRGRRLLKPSPIARTGHLRVRLSQQNRSRDVFVHVLVLETFVGPRPPGMQACHGDGDVTNNRLSNLRWGTPSANTLDSVKHGTHVQARKTHCPAGHPYVQARGRRRCRQCSEPDRVTPLKPDPTDADGGA